VKITREELNGLLLGTDMGRIACLMAGNWGNIETLYTYGSLQNRK